MKSHTGKQKWDQGVSAVIRKNSARNVLVSLSLLTFFGMASTALSQGGGPAPLNPEFVAQMEALKSKGVLSAGSDAGSGLGLGASPVDLSYLKQPFNTTSEGMAPLSFASSYDLRTLGRVTSVKNQGSAYGTCWAHATIASMESGLLPGETRNFSENHLANHHGFSWNGWVLGNGFMSMAYLVRWDGPVDETSDPYPNPGSNPSLSAVKHVQNALILPGKASATDNNLIRQTLIDYGGICASYYETNICYNAAQKSYCYSGTNDYNHLVTIVGWDDTFSKSKFLSPQPAGDGAYIVKNSWGTGWGESGYFYVSYYDAKFAKREMFVYQASSTNLYKTVYQHDPLGWVDSWGWNPYTYLWGANIFTASEAGRLSAVGFYAVAMNTSYEVYVYTGVNTWPRNGTLATSKVGTCACAGYYTVPLDIAVPLTAGQKFSIVVKFTTPGCTAPLAYEYNQSGYSGSATSLAGQSFYSLNGSGWYDIHTDDSSANVCIKGYTAIATTNGTPYVWLDQYGLVAGSNYEAADVVDGDGDGYSAKQEYVAGSVPTNRSSVLMACIAVSNAAPRVTWTPHLGAARLYMVEGKSALTNAAWLSPTNAATRFFRVKVSMP